MRVFSAGEDALDRPIEQFFRTTAIFRKEISTKNELRIPSTEKEVLGITPKSNVTVVFFNDLFDDGYIKFTGRLTNAGNLTLKASLFDDIDGVDSSIRSELSGLFIVRKGYDVDMPISMTRTTVKYLLDNTLLFKSEIRTRDSGTGLQYLVNIPTIQLDLSDFDLDTRFNISFIGLDSDSTVNNRVRRSGEPFVTSGVPMFTIPRNKMKASSLSNGDTVQVIARSPLEFL